MRRRGKLVTAAMQRRRTKLIPEEQDSRPPPAFKVPAEPGWRLVWVDVIEPEEDVVQIKPIVGVIVEPITFWGIEAPTCAPDPNILGLVNSTLGEGAQITPLHGPKGERLPFHARVFRIDSPRQWQSDEQLRAAAFKWLSKTHVATQDVKRQRRKKP